MREEKKITQEDIDNATVKLRPIGGVNPRVYIPALYGILVLIVVFLLLFLPGIVNYGSVLEFKGAPGNCAVYVDGAFKGSTSQRMFLKAGTYTLKVGHLGFGDETLELKVGGRIFGSLFSARKLAVAYSLKPDKPAELLDAAFRDYASWSLSGTPSALYQFPMVLSSAAGDLSDASVLQDGVLFRSGTDGSSGVSAPDAAAGGAVKPEDAFVRDVLSMTASPTVARDGLRASIIVASEGRPGPLSLVASARKITSALAGSAAGPIWLKDLLSQKIYGDYASVAKAAKAVTPNATQGAAQNAGQGDTSNAKPDIVSAPRKAGRLSAGGHGFVLFDAGTFTLAGQAPSGSYATYGLQVPSFGLAETEVTNAQWARFLQENPAWQPANRAELEKQRLVDRDYLSSWNGASNSLPVVHVSWYAAAAYCEWLSKKLPSGYIATLPSEAMWELAARIGRGSGKNEGQDGGVWANATRTGPAAVGSLSASPTGLSDMLGNVWEWTNDAYRPYPAFASGLFSGNEKAVRGGSWANAKDSVDIYSRGGIAAQHSSAFLGFRPAIVRR